MIDVTNFEEEVLAASHEKPVLVDFWAPWCGPCRQLGPVLERIASEDESFTLAKLNTDEDQVTAMKYGIRSIPAVKLFVNGEVADEFLGALPEPQVRRWLEQALPSETRQLVEEANRLAAEGAAQQAEALLLQVLEMQPGHPAASGLLAKLVVFRDPEQALLLARDARADAAQYDQALAVEAVASVLAEASRFDTLPDEPGKEQYAKAVTLLAQDDVDGALGALVESVRVSRRFHNEAARRTCLALFTVLGDKHPLTQKHRRALEMALF